MKFPLFLAGVALGLLSVSPSVAQDSPPPSTPAAVDLNALVNKISGKLRAGETSATALAAELTEFEALQAKYRNQKTEDVAQIALMRATLYAQVLQDEATARKLLLALKADFPGTRQAETATRALEMIERAAQSKEKLAKLIGNRAPELNFNWSSQAGLKTLSSLKGKVVVLDFWATWCGPCISSFPQVREHVAHFKDSPVTFLGVTSIQGMVANLEPGKIDTKGDPAREMSLMADFMKAKNMTWDVVFSEEPVFNPDYGVQGIPFIAIIAPDGTVRHAGLNPHDPSADITGHVTALLKEFKLPVPGSKS